MSRSLESFPQVSLKYLSLLALVAVCLCFPASAKTSASPSKSDEKVLLTADEMSFDDKTGVATATGHVEVTQGSHFLMADKVTYDKAADVVTADGNVKMLDPGGEVLFADHVQLSEQFGQGFAGKIRLLMPDNSRFVANEGERLDGRYTILHRAVYSPCKLCETDPEAPPMWQVKAVRAIHDNENKSVMYRDASMEIGGVPVAFTPYLSHPDPSVKRRSGFLTPTIGRASNLGFTTSTPYYFDIAPDMDATFTPTFSENDTFQGAGQWRKRFEKGRLEVAGSLTQADFTRTDNTVKTDQLRGHLFGSGLFDLTDVWRTGFDMRLATDKTYLTRYRYSAPDVLVNRGYVEGFSGRNYTSANIYYFQDNRSGNRPDEPIALPDLRHFAFGEPGQAFGGRWSLDSGLLALARDNDGLNTRRAVINGGWNRRFVSDTGLVTTASASTLLAGYHSDNFADPTTGNTNDNEKALRFFPAAQVTSRYPIARTIGRVHQYIEPIGQFTAAPVTDNTASIPNEDSQDVEFDETNLFALNRFTGYDRQEGGMRTTYGLRTGFYGFGGGSSSLFFGQSHRFRHDSSFAADSGLADPVSDWVGRVQITPAGWLDLNYGFRLKNEEFTPSRHDVTLSAGESILRATVNYLYSSQIIDNSSTVSVGREEVTYGLSSNFAKYYNLAATQRRDLLDNDRLLSTTLIAGYQDECFTARLIGQRDHTTVSGLESGLTVMMQLVFLNLGAIETPSVSADILKGRSSSQ
jgi:LPS-assembly protein